MKVFKMSTNVKRSEAMSNEIITAMSRACGAGISSLNCLKTTKKAFVVLYTK